MGVSDLETTIQSLRADAEGNVCSRSRVLDALLDLRLDAGGRHDIIDLVDSALAALPGKNVVRADWWRERLDLFELAAVNPVEPVA